jgi:hypothetical protein
MIGGRIFCALNGEISPWNCGRGRRNRTWIAGILVSPLVIIDLNYLKGIHGLLIG